MKQPSNKITSRKDLKTTRRRKTGLPPGTPIYTGRKIEEKIDVSIINYNDTNYTEEHFGTNTDFLQKIPEGYKSWVNINGLQNEKLIAEISNFFNLHNLIQEDILNVFQLPKAEEYPEDDIVYITLNEFYFDENKKLLRDQISLVLGEKIVLSFQEDEGDYFESVRERIRVGKGRMRKSSPDYLVYALLDAIVDSYYIILDYYSSSLDQIEDDIFIYKTKNHLENIHLISKDLIYLRRGVAPLKEVIFKLLKDDIILIDSESKKFLRDVQDHINQVLNQIDADREYLADLVQSNMANLNTHMNEIIKVLTIVSAIFIPLTFIVGVYGMNFENLPELTLRYGYGGVWVLMIVITIIQFIIYKKKKWL